MSPIVATVTTCLVVLAALRARALTSGGAVAAFAVGVAVLAGTGWAGALALGVFFVSATVASRRAERHEPAWLDAPGNRRNPRQVLANGGVAGLGGLLGLMGHGDLGLAVAVSSLAAAAADTWATAWGISGMGDPVDLRRWIRVPRGTSGAVSVRGTLGGLAGGALVAAAPLAAGAAPGLAIAAAGLGAAGMLADSLLGATFQGRFRCPRCDLPSERRVHRCGMATTRVSGWAALDNDGVNLCATAFAGLGGVAWWMLR